MTAFMCSLFYLNFIYEKFFCNREICIKKGKDIPSFSIRKVGVFFMVIFAVQAVLQTALGSNALVLLNSIPVAVCCIMIKIRRRQISKKRRKK